jgi:hypothetical protein
MLSCNEVLTFLLASCWSTLCLHPVRHSQRPLEALRRPGLPGKSSSANSYTSKGCRDPSGEGSNAVADSLWLAVPLKWKREAWSQADTLVRNGRTKFICATEMETWSLKSSRCTGTKLTDQVYLCPWNGNVKPEVKQMHCYEIDGPSLSVPLKWKREAWSQADALVRNGRTSAIKGQTKF